MNSDIARSVLTARGLALAALIASVGFTLSACGGGGGGGGGGPTANAFHISGTIQLNLANALAGGLPAGLVVTDGTDTLNVTAGATTFSLPTALQNGAAFSVNVNASPAGLACVASSNTGVINGSDVGNVVVTCSELSYTLGGSITGLVSTGLVLTNDGGDAFNVTANATSFTFPTPVAFAGAYSVAVGTQPVGETCSVTANGSGTMGAAAVGGVMISCALNSYAIGGTVAGLGVSGLVLANGTDTLVVAANATSFTMPQPVRYLSTYAVFVQAQPPGLQCSVANGAGTMGPAPVNNIAVGCRASLGGSISGLHTTGLVLASLPDSITESCSSCFPATAPIAAVVTTGTYPYAIAVDATTNKAYAVNQLDATVTAIDGATNLTMNIHVGGVPSAIAVNEGTNKIYVANSGTDNVTIIDGATNATTFVPLGTGASPIALAVNPTTNRVYVADYYALYNSVIDAANGNAVTQIPIPAGSHPESVAVNAVTNKIYVTEATGPELTVIDGGSNVAFSSAITPGPYAVTVNPVTNKVYDGESSYVTILDGSSGSVTNHVATGSVATSFAVNAVTNQIFYTNLNGSNIGMIDGATDLLTTVPTGLGPRALAIDLQANLIYVADSGANANAVTVVDGVTFGTVTVPAGASPYALAFNPTTDKLYVADFLGGGVTVLDGSAFLSFLSTTPAATVSGVPFTFPTYLAAGTAYHVAIQAQPPGQTCSLANASGTMNGIPVSNVAVSCVDTYIDVTGTVSGLTGAGLVITDGTDLIALPAGATGFTFPDPLALGAAFNVTVKTQPAGQTCSLNGGTGTIAGRTAVQVSCR